MESTNRPRWQGRPATLGGQRLSTHREGVATLSARLASDARPDDPRFRDTGSSPRNREYAVDPARNTAAKKSASPRHSDQVQVVGHQSSRSGSSLPGKRPLSQVVEIDEKIYARSEDELARSSAPGDVVTHAKRNTTSNSGPSESKVPTKSTEPQQKPGRDGATSISPFSRHRLHHDYCLKKEAA